MKKPEIILIGGGGHCKACIDVIEAEGRFKVKGIIDVPEKMGQSVLGYPYIGTDDDLVELVSKNRHFLITLGHINSPFLRIKLFNKIKDLGGEFPVIISPNTHVSPHAVILEGTIIMHGVILNASSKTGKNCIINSHALIEHDAIVGDHCHISTGARVNGMTKVGNKCFIGSGSVLNQSIEIAPETIIGSGSVVRKNIKTSGLYVGNPVKKFK